MHPLLPSALEARVGSPRAGRVEIVSGSFGAGHDAAAAAIADQLGASGFVTRTWDVVDLMPDHVGTLVRSGYLRQVQTAPATWRWVLHAVERSDAVAAAVGRALRSTERALLRIAADAPAGFVSTHPFASQALGHLRADGRIDAPVTTYLTDMSVHRLWVHPGVDAHLAVHDIPAEQARRLGARGTATVQPAVAAAFSAVRRAHADPFARRGLGLPPTGPLALVTGGSCGIGSLAATAADVAASGVATPVVLCGRNHGLRRRLTRRGVASLGWVEDMARLLSAVDVVVQNAGGITSLETAAAGVPMITYRTIAGHGETNAAALDAGGVARWVRHPHDLRHALLEALHTTPVGPAAPARPSVVESLFPAPALSA